MKSDWLFVQTNQRFLRIVRPLIDFQNVLHFGDVLFIQFGCIVIQPPPKPRGKRQIKQRKCSPPPPPRWKTFTPPLTSRIRQVQHLHTAGRLLPVWAKNTICLNLYRYPPARDGSKSKARSAARYHINDTSTPASNRWSLEYHPGPCHGQLVCPAIPLRGGRFRLWIWWRKPRPLTLASCRSPITCRWTGCRLTNS